jgi:hypothetical protein
MELPIYNMNYYINVNSTEDSFSFSLMMIQIKFLDAVQLAFHIYQAIMIFKKNYQEIFFVQMQLFLF